MKNLSVPLLVTTSLLISGCASLVSNMATQFGNNLSSSFLNQDDPELVRAGMPSYILLLDSFLQGEEDNTAILASAATMYASYGAVFANDESRAAQLTRRGRDYADNALCKEIEESCAWRNISYDAFAVSLGNVDEKHAELIYTYGFASLAYIRAHSSDWNALAQIPQATAVMERYIVMSGEAANPSAHNYLGILMTFRGEMGGQMDQGRAQFEQAIAASGNQDLSAKLEYLKGYARARYDRELNDKLCGEILNANPDADDYTLTNVMAQKEATVVCAEADDYF
jgi:hypothetical protein